MVPMRSWTTASEIPFSMTRRRRGRFLADAARGVNDIGAGLALDVEG
jgi:hypothetical protein